MATIPAVLISNQNVYAGPGTSYEKIGSVSTGESVFALFREGTYCYIQYSVGSTGVNKCGYVQTNKLSDFDPQDVDSFSPSYENRYVRGSVQTYWGPGAAYAMAFPVPRGLQVQKVGMTDGTYTLIEFEVSGELYRAFVRTSNLTTTRITTDVHTKMIELADLEIGYEEGANNDTKFGDWIGYPNQAWCASFVSWCAAFADNAVESTTPASPKIYKTASVQSMKKAFQDTDRYSTTPNVGAAAFFSTSHVGLVVAVDGNSIDVIEGNSSNAVTFRTYTRASSGTTYTNPNATSGIVGFGY